MKPINSCDFIVLIKIYGCLPLSQSHPEFSSDMAQKRIKTPGINIFYFTQQKAKTFLRSKLFYAMEILRVEIKKLLERERWFDVIFPSTAHTRKERLRDLNRADSFLAQLLKRSTSLPFATVIFLCNFNNFFKLFFCFSCRVLLLASVMKFMSEILF